MPKGSRKQGNFPPSALCSERGPLRLLLDREAGREGPPIRKPSADAGGVYIGFIAADFAPCSSAPAKNAMLLARLAGLCAALLLAVSVSAESVRETEIMDPKLNIEEFASGDLPDDEDARSDLTIDYDEGDEFSGSGDGQGYTDMEDKVVSATGSTLDSMDNSIPDSKNNAKNEIEPAVIDNEIVVPKKSPEGEDVSNKVSMASTADGSIFERTEVLAALIAGGAVGLLFAVFLILLLIYRMKKKDEGSYDLGKKPIYKKAPTNEFYA